MNEAISFRWPWDSWRISPLWPRDSRSSMQCALLRILAVSHHERLQPALLVANLAQEHVGSNRRVLKRLARRLKDGLPLVAAIEQTPEALSDSQVLAIRYGTQSGTLGAVYQELLSRDGDTVHSAERSLRQTSIYLGLMLMILTIAFCYWLVSLLPMFESVELRDQNRLAPLSPGFPLQFMFSLREWVGDWAVLAPFGLAILLLLVWLLPSQRWLRRVFNSRIGWINQVRSAELLRMLALSIESGRPLAGALSTLARYHFDPGVRARLLLARNEVEQGADVWESLRDARVISATQTQALATSTSAESQVWLLRSLSDQKQERAQASAQAAARRLQTAVILAIAALVFLLTLVCFQSLNHFITQLL